MFKGLKIIPYNTTIEFIGHRFANYGLSLLITVVSLGFIFSSGFNLGIDFSGGTLMEIRTPEAANLSHLRKTLGSMEIGEVTLQEYGSPQDVLIRLERKTRNEAQQAEVIAKVKDQLGAGIEYRRVENVGPKAGAQMVENGIKAGLWAILAMLIYVWFRFDWHYGLCAVISLLHDMVAVLGLYAVFGLEFNITAIVAVLITLGYSINDTVVIYDRIRENIKLHKFIKLPDLINRSINETLSRTILTSTSTLLPLIALYFFGGEVIANYSLPIFIGILVGTYSSIALSAPLLLTTGLSIEDEDDKKKKKSPANAGDQKN